MKVEKIKVFKDGLWREATTSWIENDGTYLVTVDGVDSWECMGDISKVVYR